MLRSGNEDHWSDEDLDRALGDLLAKSPVDPASLGRVKSLIGPAAAHAPEISTQTRWLRSGEREVRLKRPGPGLRHRPAGHLKRHRTTLLIAAVAVTVAAAITVPLALFHSTPAPTVSTGVPLTTKACATHNQTANDASADGAPAASGPSVSAGTSWYSPAKAAQLSMALKASLPPGTCVFKGSQWGDLTFPDQLNPGDVTPAVGQLDAQAGGRLVTAAGDGDLSVSIFHAANAKLCLAGGFDRTLTDRDGTVIWQLTTSATTTNTKWAVLVVTAYQPNGTCSTLRVSDERLGADDTPTRPGMTATGTPPLNLAQLTALATAPGLTTAHVSDTGTSAALFSYTPQNAKTELSYPAGQRLPLPTLSGPDLTGTKTLRTSDYPGKIMVLNFWGAWCAPCPAEADQLRPAAAAFDPADVQFLGINVKDTASAARAFVGTSHIPYPSISDPTDQAWQAVSGEPAGSLPVTIVLDREHRVAHVWLQPINRTDLTKIVQTLLKEK